MMMIWRWWWWWRQKWHHLIIGSNTPAKIHTVPGGHVLPLSTECVQIPMIRKMCMCEQLNDFLLERPNWVMPAPAVPPGLLASFSAYPSLDFQALNAVTKANRKMKSDISVSKHLKFRKHIWSVRTKWSPHFSWLRLAQVCQQAPPGLASQGLQLKSH